MPEEQQKSRAREAAELMREAQEENPGIAELAEVYGTYQEALAISNAYLLSTPSPVITAGTESQ